MAVLTDVFLLSTVVLVALGVALVRDLFAVVMLFGIYSLLSALLYAVLDAPDVAMTEAAVGAGVSTVLMLVTLSLVGREEARSRRTHWLGLGVVTITAAVLVYGLSDAPRFGDPAAPIHHHVAPYYLEETAREIGVPNVVTAVLASYRGYDTLGETSVIFTAGVGVIALLGALRRRDQAARPG